MMEVSVYGSGTVEKKTTELKHKFKGNGDAFLSLAWSCDNETLAAGTRGTNGTVFVWDLTTVIFINFIN